jgi:uncharacterized membrane protein YbhN (UPF0104 family)
MVASLVDRRLWSNLLQLIAGCIGAVFGAVYAYPISPDYNWIAAIIGAVLGFIAAVLITGAFLAFMPAATTHRRLEKTVYLRLVRQMAIALFLYLVNCALCFVLFLLLPQWIGQQNTIGYTLSLLYIGQVFVTIMQCRIIDIGCPTCGEPFGIHNPFKPNEHKCTNCQQPFMDTH